MRNETPLQRADRAYGEILQEVRVAQTGVQILFAFLLSLAFTARFKTITPLQRDIYVVTLMLSAAATALLIAPAAFHRVVYRRRLKQHLVHAANRLALAGLVLLLLAMISALVLILDVVTGMGPAVVLASVMLVWFFTWWFILPVCSRLRHPASPDFGSKEKPNLPGLGAGQPPQHAGGDGQFPGGRDSRSREASADGYEPSPAPDGNGDGNSQRQALAGGSTQGRPRPHLFSATGTKNAGGRCCAGPPR